MRILQFNIEDPYGYQLEHVKPEDIVEFAKDIKANALVVFARDGWGRAFYKSSTYPPHPKVGEDFLKRLKEACSKAGIKLIAMVCHTSNKYLGEKHPEWIQRNAKGEVIALDSVKTDDLHWPLMCPNSGFFDICLKEVEEVLDLADGIMLDSFRYQPDFRLACACKFCKEEFKKKYGGDLPQEEDWNHPYWWKAWFWRYNVVVEKLKKVKEKCGKKPLIYNSHPAGWGWRANTVVELAREYLDVIFAESSETDFQPLGFLIEIVKLSKGLSGKEIWATRNSFHVFSTSFPTSKEAFELGVWEIVSAGGHPMALVFLSAFVQYQDELRFIGEVFSKVERVEEFLDGAEPVEEIGIAYSNATRDIIAQGEPDEYNEEVRGFFYALLNMHYQVGFIGDRDISFDKLKRFKVLILPNKAVMSEAEAKAISKFIDSGGKVLATYLTSLYDGTYKRADFLLAEEFGASFYGVEGERWLYFDGVLFGDYKDSVGRYAVVRPRREEYVIGEVRRGAFRWGYEYTLGRSPPPAGGVASYVTRNRATYIPFQLGRSLFRFGHPKQYYALKKLLAFEGIISTDAPETVRIIVWRRSEQLLIHLLNETVNQRVVVGQPVQTTFTLQTSTGINPIREVVPVGSFSITIKHKVLSAELALSGKKLEVKRHGEMSKILIPRLDIYDLLVVEFE